MKADTESNKTTKSGKAVPLTREEQAKVTEACLKHGALVKQIATEYVRFGLSLELEDLMQLGYEALVKAVREWKEDGGASFVTIANLRIRDVLRTAVGVKVDRNERNGKHVLAKNPMRDAQSLSGSPLCGEDDENIGDAFMFQNSFIVQATQEDETFRKQLQEKVLKKLPTGDLALIHAHLSGSTDLEIAAQAGCSRPHIQARRSRANKFAIETALRTEPLALVA